jgi:hypothetical protein
MDDLTLFRSFRAECADDDPQVRAAAWRALEAKFDPTLTTSSAIPARSRRRGLFALAGAAALAAIVTGLLVFSSGPTAEPAAAEVLRETAAIAATTGSPAESPPGPGQFLYAKTKTLEYQSWIPGGSTSMGGPLNRPDAFAALVPTDRENWLSPAGSGRWREVMGTPQFLSDAEQDRWEQAGSPLPRTFDPRYQDGYRDGPGAGHVLELRRGVLDMEVPKPQGRGLGPNFGFPDVAGLPTEPEALRLALQSRPRPGTGNQPGGKPAETPLDTEETILALWGILQQPMTAPPLRAAVFNALAELPGIGLNRDATDLVGRSGYAISFDDKQGLRGEYIFDPKTSEILGQRTVLLAPGLARYASEWIPAGNTIRDVAYLQSGVVDSIHETAGMDGPVPSSN